MRRHTAWVLTSIGFALITLATLIPTPRHAAAARLTPIWCLVCGDHGTVDVLNNLLLFMPFGAGLRLLRVRLRTVAAVGALISLTIESLQFAVIPGRDAALSDVVTNSIGSWMGAALIDRRMELSSPNTGLARRLAVAGTLVWWTLQFASGVLLRPWAPPGQLRAVWQRPVPGREPFDGRVLSAVVSGIPVPQGVVPLSSELRQRIRDGLVHLQLGLTSGGSASWSPVFELMGPSRSLLSVEAVGRDLAFEAPARSAVLRLRRPALRLPDALPRSSGARVQLTAGERNDTLWAVWTAPSGKHTSEQVVSPSFGWSLVTPVWYAYGPGASWITGLWIAGWLLPVGYWSARVGIGRHSILWLLTIVLLVGLGAIPALLGYSPVTWSEWGAGVLGLAAGQAGYRLAAYYQKRCDSHSTSGSSSA